MLQKPLVRLCHTVEQLSTVQSNLYCSMEDATKGFFDQIRLYQTISPQLNTKQQHNTYTDTMP